MTIHFVKVVKLLQWLERYAEDILGYLSTIFFIEKLGFEWQNGASFEYSFLAAFRDNYKNLLLLHKNKQ